MTLKTETLKCEVSSVSADALPVIIVAGGSSLRMNGIDKQLAEICGIPVIVRTMLAFENSEYISRIIVVTKPESITDIDMLAAKYMISKLTDIVSGGSTRHESVLKGMSVLCENEGRVLIHDGARPFVKDKMIFDCVNALKKAHGCLTALKATDTVKICENEAVKTTLDRNKIYFAQTPQGVDSKLYKRICESVSDTDFTDDASVLESSGEKVIIVNGDRSNIKITTPFDLVLAEAIVREEEKCE